MKIGIDIRSLASGRQSGVEEYVRGLLRELFLQGGEHEFILFFNAWGSQEPDLSFATGFPNVTIKRFRLPNKLLNFLLWYMRLPKLDRLLGGVDVFFLPNMNFAAVSRKTKLVVTVHDLSFEWFPETFSWKQRLWHYLVNLRGLLRRADALVAVSQATADDIHERYRIDRQKIFTIHSGVNENFGPLDRNDIRLIEVQKKYQLPYRFILSLGTLEPRKNLISLVRAYEAFHHTAVGELVKYELVIAGPPGWKCEELLESIRRSPVKHHIHLLGFVDERDKAALYTLASVFVYPSFYEGFGFPPLEALTCGIPVIASHSSSLPEVVGDAGLLIDPYRPDEILQALRQVLSDKDLSLLLHERALQNRHRFSWQQSASEFLQLLKSL
ncbi:glycosyltransferase family 1 protein [Candidatus Dojkabacteria bacterium]|uniref:Glycosyltransferase family 1 protein n=1 Tax=Candidatus Dojkabacteria bacterium TaxID=2099670 RepID=A0A5C7JAR1_9BACT|nr:MAG: glycosyltransferase family 1 protein [Candidatus Dojkabacteria bacterium]